MFTVTKQVLFPQTRKIDLVSNSQPPPPLVVSLEFDCETEEEVNAVATLGPEVVREIGKELQGYVVFSQAAEQIFHSLHALELQIQAVSITPGPGFTVKYTPENVYSESELSS